MKEKISITLDSGLLSEVDAQIDNILIRNRSQAIENLLRKTVGNKRTAVILCGGKEESIKISEGVYRPTAKIGGETVIEKAVKQLRENKFKNIYIIARNKVLTKVFEILKDGNDFGVKIEYVEEKNAKGTADSLRLLRGKVKEKFLVVYGDLVFDRVNIESLWKSHSKTNHLATLMLTTSANYSEKGTVYMEGNSITRFIQKPQKSDNYLVFSPIFLADSELFSWEGESLEKTVFPKMAEKGLLGGYFSSEKEVHVHNEEDIKNKIN